MMNDNQIRIPSTEYLGPYGDRLTAIYEPLANSQACAEFSPDEARRQFIDTYEEATKASLALMHGPVARGNVFYSVSSTDASVKNSPREICAHTANQLFDSALYLAKQKGPAEIDAVLAELHDAVYWARRAGFADEPIEAKLKVVEEAFTSWFRDPPDSDRLVSIFSAENLMHMSSSYQMISTYQAVGGKTRELNSLLLPMRYFLEGKMSEEEFMRSIQENADDRETLSLLMQAVGDDQESCFDIVFRQTIELAESRNDPTFCLSPEQVKARFDLMRRLFQGGL